MDAQRARRYLADRAEHLHRRGVLKGMGVGLVAVVIGQPVATPASVGHAAGDGDMLVGSCYSKSVLRYDARTGEFVDAFVEPGSGGLECPEGTMLIGPDGHLYVASFSPARTIGGVPHQDQVLRYDGETGDFSDVFVPPSDLLDGPHGLAFGPDGHLYVSTRFTDSVLRYDGETGRFVDVFVRPSSGGLDDPSCLIFRPDGLLYVSSYSIGVVFRYDATTGRFVDVFAPTGSGAHQAHLHHMIFGPDGHLYTTSYPNNAVLRYDGGTGEFLDVFVAPNSGELDFPATLAFGPDGHLYVAAGGPNNEVLRYDGGTGEFLDVFIPSNRGGLHGPSTLAFRRRAAR